jgi:hypothetical protein
MTETIIYKINKNYVKYSQLDIIKDISIITEYIEIYKSETYVYYYAVNYNNYNNDNYVVFTNERFMEINNGTIKILYVDNIDKITFNENIHILDKYGKNNIYYINDVNVCNMFKKLYNSSKNVIPSKL